MIEFGPPYPKEIKNKAKSKQTSDMTLTLADLKKSKEICGTATEGPWKAEVTKEGHVLIRLGVEDWRDIGFGDMEETDGQDHSNQEFIAHARTMLPATLKLVREMYELLKRIHPENEGPIDVGELIRLNHDLNSFIGRMEGEE